MRSNLHAGGKMAKAKVTDEMLQIAEIVRPKLHRATACSWSGSTSSATS